MRPISRNALGMTFGTVAVLFHIVWLVMVWIGVAKTFLDFVLLVHHLTVSYNIIQFSSIRAIILIVITFVGGYILGFILASFWNAFNE
jgi:ABC-type transport system involved in cytochrome c biogenesis permease subunit